MNVNEIMTREVATCSPDSTLETVAKTMWERDCGSIPILDEQGTPIGMITDRDIAMAGSLQHRPLWEITTREVTNGRGVFTCNTEDPVRNVLRTMWAQRVRRLPVIDPRGRLVGIVSIDDIVACAQRGARGGVTPDLSYDDAMTTLKAVCKHH